MNVYEVRVDGVTKKVTADHYDREYNCGCVGLRFYRVINDPNSEDKAKVVAEFTHYDFVTLESDSADYKLNLPQVTLYPYNPNDLWDRFGFPK